MSDIVVYAGNPAAVLTGVEPHTAAERRRDRQLVIGCVIVGVYVAAAALAPVLPLQDPNEVDVLNRLASPSGAHWLGTDHAGRDTFSRVVHAARTDVPLGFVLAVLPAVIGTLLGSLAGYFGRFADMVVMRVAELVQAFPFYILILALVAVLEPGVRSIVLVFGLIGWVPYASLVRAELLRVREQEYMQAAVVSGLSRWRVLVRHGLPNSLDQVLAYLPADVLFAMVSLAGLSFLGIGIQPPTPEWGGIISEGRAFALTNWWLVAAPGLALVLLGVGLMLIGDSISRRLGTR